MSVISWRTQASHRLELKTRPRFRPVSSALSIHTQDLYAPLDSEECGQVTFVPLTLFPPTVFLQPIENSQSQDGLNSILMSFGQEFFPLKTVVCVIKL